MATSEDQLKRAADLKLWMESRIAELQDEADRLREALTLVDGILRASSFKPAIEVSSAVKEELMQIPEIKELKRDRSGETIAVAQITKDRLVLEPVAEVALKSETSPFKSFLLGKILAGMKSQDEELVAKGQIEKGQELRFDVAERNGKISSLTVNNYRDRERLSEIINTVGWTFSRMLEKQATSAR